MESEMLGCIIFQRGDLEFLSTRMKKQEAAVCQGDIDHFVVGSKVHL